MACATWIACWLAAADAPDFDRRIAPLLAKHCLDCHSGAAPEGKLDLSRKAAAGKAFVPGKPAASAGWQRVAADEMPPKQPLPAADRAALEAWIAAGAKWGADPIDPYRHPGERRAGYDWWSLQPVVRPPPPPVRNERWVRNPIDRFVLAKLEAAGLAPSPEADRRTLLRRLSFDLLGLPPSHAEVEAFRADPAPDAFERAVDRMLASPHHGERWARHWLDAVRYGESNGYEHNEPRPHAWPYRDWTIRALNADLPYDEFVRLQLAGDVLRPDDPDAVAATGFLVAGVRNVTLGNAAMRALARQDELEDMVSTVGQTLLGLTAQCARCHDHKFDPVPMRDYYALAAAFDGVHPADRKLPKTGGLAYAVAPKPAGAVRVLRRGQPSEPGEAVAPAGLSAVRVPKPDLGLATNAPDAERRKRLAAWIAAPDNGPFARTAANRLWHGHFGTGIVDTPNDLGFNGGRPSHPELLDWLAAELVARKHSQKAMHRLIVCSAAYRQASAPRPEGLARDASARLLWRMPPRRLEAEALRDALLDAAGALDRSVGGPGFADYRTVSINNARLYEPFDPATPASQRRSIYRFVPRAPTPGLLEAFDCPDNAALAARRATTVTPLQALALWNNAFVLRMADRMADRVRAVGDPAAQVQAAWRAAFQRDPTPAEAAAARTLAEAHGLPTLCRALLNANEFVTVE